MIIVVDYGVGNISSMLNMLEFLGVEALPSREPADIGRASALVLPGVGAFDKAMKCLRETGSIGPLTDAVLRRRVPVLGVCLGMQLLARCSEEGESEGLGWIDADVRRIRLDPASSLKVPHIGWSIVRPTRPSALFPDVDAVERFYFVHGYHMVCRDPDTILATVKYGADLCCAVQQDNVWGVQFHPEKSHRFGMRLLAAFSAYATSIMEPT